MCVQTLSAIARISFPGCFGGGGGRAGISVIIDI